VASLISKISGDVGRLTAEKNERALARLERALFDRGHRDFRFVVVGEGAEREWLQVYS
jgi:hypothetical protein